MRKEELKAYLPEYLTEKGLPINKPFCCINPEHADRHPSMSFDAKRNKVHCFSCGATYDIFDCCKIFESIINTKEAFEFIEKKYTDILPVKKKPFSEENSSRESFSEFILPFCEQSAMHTMETTYFTERGISEQTVMTYRLGYVAKTDKTGAFITIPNGVGNYTIRFLTGNKKNRYLKIGQASLFNVAALNSGKPVVVTEGEFDALSVIEAGGQALALGSTANWEQLCKIVTPAHKIILCLDNDKDGEATQRKLADFFTGKGILYKEINLAGEYKDCNEALVNDRQNFTRRITALSGEQQNVNSALYILNHLKSAEPIPTGFKALDEMLGGGLYNELYIIGGVSSVGKTTFLLQMADQIAKAGTNVDFFTLEMSPEQIVAKSLSRISGNVTSRQVLKGETDTLSQEVYDNYVAIAKNEQIYQTKDLSKIKDNGSVIFIDYLQLLSLGGKGSDKQNVDSTVFALKELSRTHPVVVLSSLCRMGYKEAVSMESFKESGNIEYTADVLLGLQFAGVTSQKFDLNKAKRAAKRQVEITILKNKNGPCGDIVNYEYVPQFNLFTEKKN